MPGEISYGDRRGKRMNASQGHGYHYPVPTEKGHWQPKESDMRMAILLFLVFIAPMGNAQQIYKCVAGKDVSYQSAPCSQTQKIAKQWDATPEPEPSAEELREREAKRQRDEAESARLRRASNTGPARVRKSGGHASLAGTGGNRCDAAKARREAKLKAVGLKRTFDLLRKLDDAVYDACK